MLPFGLTIELIAAAHLFPAGGRRRRAGLRLCVQRRKVNAQDSTGIITAAAVVSPVIREGIYACLGEGEGLGSIRIAISIQRIRVVHACVVRYIQRVRAAIGSCSTVHPLVGLLAVDQHPLVSGLEVIRERVFAVEHYRRLDGLERTGDDLAEVLFAALTTEVESIFRILIESLECNRINSGIQRNELRRYKVRSGVRLQAVLPYGILYVIPNGGSGSAADTGYIELRSGLACRRYVYLEVGDMEVVVSAFQS